MQKGTVMSRQQKQKFARADASSMGTIADAIKLHGRHHHEGHWDFDPRYKAMKQHFRNPRPRLVMEIEVEVTVH